MWAGNTSALLRPWTMHCVTSLYSWNVYRACRLLSLDSWCMAQQIIVPSLHGTTNHWIITSIKIICSLFALSTKSVSWSAWWIIFFNRQTHDTRALLYPGCAWACRVIMALHLFTNSDCSSHSNLYASCHVLLHWFTQAMMGNKCTQRWTSVQAC